MAMPGRLMSLSQAFFSAAIIVFTSACSYGDPHEAFAGIVTSSEEGRMEGVLVSAKSEQRPITVTVVSNSEGRFSFPPDHLQPGIYDISIRATGYELDQVVRVTVTDNATSTAD